MDLTNRAFNLSNLLFVDGVETQSVVEDRGERTDDFRAFRVDLHDIMTPQEVAEALVVGFKAAGAALFSPVARSGEDAEFEVTLQGQSVNVHVATLGGRRSNKLEISFELL